MATFLIILYRLYSTSLFFVIYAHIFFQYEHYVQKVGLVCVCFALFLCVRGIDLRKG